MSANGKKIRYRKITCPHCGNDLVAKGVKEAQRCCFCRRKYKIIYSWHGRKVCWEPVIPGDDNL